MLKRKIRDWGQRCPLVVQMCGDQLLLVRRNKTPLTSWDPSLKPKTRLSHAGQNAWNLLRSRILHWYKADVFYHWEGNKKLCNSTLYHHHHHRIDANQSLVVMVRRRAGAPRKFNAQGPGTQGLPKTESVSGGQGTPTMSSTKEQVIAVFCWSC